MFTYINIKSHPILIMILAVYENDVFLLWLHEKNTQKLAIKKIMIFVEFLHLNTSYSASL